MEFEIGEKAQLKVADLMVTAILNEVYVGDNFVQSHVATKLFEYTELKKRGTIICAIEKQSSSLAGVVIYVSGNSFAAKLAKENEAEMHLLCVKKKYRKCGIGKLLVNSVIDMATQNGKEKMILWTQKNMLEAQRLYESSNFVHISNMKKNNIEFLVYEKDLHV